MKIEKNDIFFGIGLVAIGVILAFIISDDKKEEALNPSPFATITASPSESASPSSTPTVSVNTQKPEVKFEETQNYAYWFDRMDPENRVLGVYDECASLVPSNVAYKNNVQVMLDNTRSSQKHVIKIGAQEYTMEADRWYLVNLSSPTVPARLPIYCEGIELGQIDLE